MSGQICEATTTGFGTTVRLLVRHASKVRARNAIQHVFGELERIESLMSIYRPESQVSVLNREQRLQSADPMLVEIIRQADGIARQTAGAFDLTVQPLWELYWTAARTGELPGDAELQRAQAAIGSRNVVVDNHDIVLHNRASITLNGIAQGFATDRAAHVLRTHGIQDALIDVGELAALGTKDNGECWQAGIQHPRRADAYSALVPLKDRCLATSGDYQTNFTSDFQTHHIFDPRTGCSPDEVASVTVSAPTATEADAWSTALLVTGVRRGVAILDRLAGVDAMFIHKDGRTWATAGFPKAERQS
jgi:thiamine biosynthesis lipoprotein